MASHTKDDNFGAYLIDMTNKAFICHGTAIGYNLGLFELLSCGKAMTIVDLAEKSNCKKRYIQEWLAIMVTGNIVDYEPSSQTYSLRTERVPYLTKQGGKKNMGLFISGIPIITNTTEQLQQCFEVKGPKGIPESDFKGIHGWRKHLAESSFPWNAIKSMLCEVPQLVAKLESGITVCDGGCGYGHQVLCMAEHYPNSHFTGFDFDGETMAKAREEAVAKKISNIEFLVEDCCNMPEKWSEKYDLFIVWNVVHDVPYPDNFLKEVLRVLKPQGQFLMIDIGGPTDLQAKMNFKQAPTTIGFSLFHCMPVSLYYNGAGLGSEWGIEKQLEYLQRAGFADITPLNIADPSQNYIICNKQP